jgi:nucleoside-diphosphate-sugar epimerase
MTIPTVLLTGATGFLGGATAAELLRRPTPLRLLLLIRAPSRAEGEARLRRSLTRFIEADRPDYDWDRCTVLCGDLTEPASFVDARLDTVTHVLHLAANTSFRSVRGARRTNLFGTQALAQRMCGVPTLVRFLHVGTGFICGADPPRVVREEDYPQPGVGHLVEYTRSKAEAELHLEEMVPELPLIVARPSVVVGHTRLGCGPSASIFWYYRALDLLRRAPAALQTRKDIVPVDYVARTLIHLLFAPALRCRRYHISAGKGSAVSWQEMADVFARYHGARGQEPCRVVDVAELGRERARVNALLGAGDVDALLQAMALFFRFGACGVEAFANDRLLAEGVPAPPRFTDYMPVCIESSLHRNVYEQMRDDC